MPLHYNYHLAPTTREPTCRLGPLESNSKQMDEFGGQIGILGSALPVSALNVQVSLSLTPNAN